MVSSKPVSMVRVFHDLYHHILAAAEGAGLANYVFDELKSKEKKKLPRISVSNRSERSVSHSFMHHLGAL